MSYDEDPDFVLIGKKRLDDELCNELSVFALSFVDLLANYDERLDPRSYPTSLDKDIDEWIQPQKIEEPSILPYASIVDLNNSDKEPYENKPKNAIEVGINVKF